MGTSAMVIVALSIMLSLLSQAPTSVQAQCTSTTLVNISYFEDTIYLYEGKDANVTIAVDVVRSDGVLSFKSSDDAYFTIVDETFSITTDDVFPRNITVTIRGKLISISELHVRFTPDTSGDVITVGSQTIGVRRVPTLLQAIYIYVLMAWIILSYLSMGGSMDTKAIWQKVRRPWGVLIGIFSQFIFMPAMTYAIARLAAGKDPTIALGIILVGTCPGGWLSNVFSVLLDVDFVLSVTMTFFSSVIAMGMMPLNLFIYATPFTKDNGRLSTPYRDLIIQLILLVVPCFIGIALRWKYPKFGYYSTKVMKPISAMLIVLGLSLGAAADYYAFISSPAEVWIVSFVTPMFGAFFGLALSRIFARDIRTSITIALETGIQNALLGRTIVGLFYPQPEADLITRVLLITVIFTIIEGAGAALLYSIFRYVCCKKQCARILGSEDEEDDEVKVTTGDMSTSGPKSLYTVSGNDTDVNRRDVGIDNPALEMNNRRQ